jgi:hypothetical protein
MDSGWLLKQGNSIRKGWRPRWFWIDHEQHCLKYAEKQGVRPRDLSFGSDVVMRKFLARLESRISHPSTPRTTLYSVN